MSNIEYFLKILFFITGIIVIYLLVLYCIQDYLILHPDKKYIPPKSYFSEKFVKMSDETDVRLWISKGDSNKPLILFFHGNRGQNSALSEQMFPLIQKGYSVAMMEYRGFGEAPGQFTQDRIFKDAEEVFDNLIQSGYKEVIPYGYSLGTAVATYLASQRPVTGLILTAPFVSLKELVGERPVPFARVILKYPFKSDVYAKNVSVPVLIIHGKKDSVISYHHSQKLYNAFSHADKTVEFLDKDTHRSIFFEGHNIPIILKWLTK